MKQKTFALENISIIPLAIAFILGSLSHKALLFGILALLLVVGYLVYKKASLKPALIYIYPSLPILALWQVYLDQGMFALFGLSLSLQLVIVGRILSENLWVKLLFL